MNPSEVADWLDDLTGAWTPSGAATGQDLRDARRRLANALLGGIMPQLTQVTPGFRTRLGSGDRPAIDAVAQAAQPDTTIMPSVRGSADIDPAAGAGVIGMKIASTLGPFTDPYGLVHWIDLIPLVPWIPIASATRGMLGALMVSAPSAVLGPGSLWVAVAALNIPAAKSGVVGVSFTSGTLSHVGGAVVSNTGVHIGASGKVTLDLVLAPPSPTPGLPGLGEDAVRMSVTSPAHVAIEFTEAGATFTTIGDAAASVYGTGFALKRNAQQPGVLNIGQHYVVWPCDASVAQFACQTVLSADVVPSGQSGVTGAGWGLPIAMAAPQHLGAASSAGRLFLGLGAGLSLRFGNLSAPVALARAMLAVAPGSIIIAARNGSRDITDRLALWDPLPPPALLEPPPDRHSSEVGVTIPRQARLLASVSGREEMTLAFGRARANVDRPVAADGRRLPLAFTRALIGFARTTTRFVVVSMSAPDLAPDGTLPQAVIALENALLRVRSVATGLLYAHAAGSRFVGALELTFDGARLLPMLPDPYASANAVPLPLTGIVSAFARWTTQPGVSLSFGFSASSSTSGPDGRDQAAMVARHETTLLDLSGNADQFGVSFALEANTPSTTAFDGMALAVPQERLAVYALPGISWEPVVEEKQDDWLDAPSTDDGPPTRLRVNTVNLVRVEPNVALPALAQAAANVDVAGEFTLPFGLMAALEIPANTPSPQRPSLSLVNADYASGLSNARQLSIRAQSVIKVGDPALPGFTTTGSPVPVPLGSTTYGVLTLGNDPLGAAQFFDQEFSVSGTYPQVPVPRIDLSGYGTSMFSDWKNLDLNTVGVVRARFDVLVGRTAYELVQLATIVIPWGIRITQTIIFDRYDSGLVVRHASGWKAVGTGEFEPLGADQKVLGPVEYLQNVHNIVVGNGQTIAFTSPDVHEPTPPSQQPPAPTPLRKASFVPVTFDADIMMDPSVTAVSNGNVSRLVAGTRIQGYAQLAIGPAASALEVLTCMGHLPDGVSGSVGCVLNVGSAPGPNAPKFTLNVSSLTAKVTTANVTGKAYPALAVAVHGTPRLPRDGAWGMARRGASDTAPTAVDPTFPIPLTLGSNNDGNYQWRMLDPADALSANAPSMIYGLLQGTGTSKTLFENPVISMAGQSLLLDPARGVPAPKLADIGALLGAAGIFPNLANVLRIPAAANDALDLARDGFKKTFDWTLEQSGGAFLDDQTLLDLGIVSLVLQYHGPDSANHEVATHATFTIDADPAPSAPRWSLALDHLSLAARIQGLGSDPLLTIHGGFAAREGQKPGFNNIQIDYGNALSLITNIISGLTTLVEAMGGAVGLDVGFSDNKLTVRDAFALPSIPLGLGEVKDLAVDLGMALAIPDHADFHVGLGSHDKPFTWIVDPLAGTGAVVLGTTDGDLGVYIEAGIGAALAIDVAVASGSASIILELSISTNVRPFALTAALVGNATVDVLGGLASASITLAASITVVPKWPTASLLPDPTANPPVLLPNEVDFTGAVAVGIHISVAWVVSVDFDGSWSFSQSVPLHLPQGIQ